MRKLILSAVATAMLTVTGASANSCDKEAVVNGFNNNKHKIGKLLKGSKDNYITAASYFDTISKYGLNNTIGTLQNNTSNLQLPSGSIQQNSDWSSIFMKIRNYISFSPDEKEFYYRFNRYIKAVHEKNPVDPMIITSVVMDEGQLYKAIYKAFSTPLELYKSNMEREKAIQNLILFSMAVDSNRNNSFAVSKFSKHDEWFTCVKQAIGL
jgi:hypothetical protein